MSNMFSFGKICITNCNDVSIFCIVMDINQVSFTLVQVSSSILKGKGKKMNRWIW